MKYLLTRIWVVPLVLLVLAGVEMTYFVAADVAYNKVAAPPLDDTFIHFQYAKQIARGRFFRYQDGDEVSTGATSFLYPILLAPFWAVGLRGVSLIWAAHFLNGLALALAMIFVWLALRRLSDDEFVAVSGALLVGLNGWFMWGVASGMAIGVTAAALAATLWGLVVFLQEGKRLGAAFALGLLAMLRPEGLVLAFALVGALALWFAVRQWTSRQAGGRTEEDKDESVGVPSRLSEVVVAAARRLGWPIWVAVGLGLVPTVLLAVLSGHMTTNGMLVKSHFAHDMDWVRYLWETGRTIVAVPGRLVTSSNGMVSQLFFVGTIASVAGLLRSDDEGRRAFGWMLAAAFASIIAFYGFLIEHIEHHNRYYMPYVPLVAVAAALGFEVLSQPFGDRLGKTLRRVVLVVVLSLGAGSLGLWARTYARNCSDIAGHYLPMVDWMKSHLPKDAKVAIHDAGAIPYLSGRRCYDMIGLVSNEFRPPGGARSDGFVWETLERIKPGYMVVYPNFFPALTRLPLLEKIHSVRLAQTTIAGGREKTAYRFHWDKLMDADRPAAVSGARGAWRLKDQVDVGDLVSEAKHGYGAGQGSLHGPARFRLAVLKHGGKLLIDGGRVIRNGEDFVLHGVEPNKPLALVLRSRMGKSGTLTVTVQGKTLPTVWQIGSPEDRSRAESWFEIPADLVSGSTIRVHLGPSRGFEYESLHYFALQP